MTRWTQDDEGGSNGVTMTTGNTGSSTSTAASVITSTPTFSTTAAYHGALGMDSSLAAQTSKDFRWNTTGIPTLPTSDFYVRDYVKEPSIPSAISRTFQTFQAGGARWGVATDTTGKKGVRNLSSGVYATSGLSTSVITAGAWYRYEAHAVWNGTSWTVELRLYLTNPDAALGSYDEVLTTTSGLTTGMTAADTLAFGANTTASATWTVYHDSFGIDDTTWLGPAQQFIVVSAGASPTTTLAPIVNQPIATSVSASPTVTAAATLTRFGTASVSASPVVTAGGIVTQFISASASASPTVTAAGTLARQATASVSASPLVTAGALITQFISASATASPTISASATVVPTGPVTPYSTALLVPSFIAPATLNPGAGALAALTPGAGSAAILTPGNL